MYINITTTYYHCNCVYLYVSICGVFIVGYSGNTYYWKGVVHTMRVHISRVFPYLLLVFFILFLLSTITYYGKVCCCYTLP